MSVLQSRQNVFSSCAAPSSFCKRTSATFPPSQQTVVARDRPDHQYSLTSSHSHLTPHNFESSSMGYPNSFPLPLIAASGSWAQSYAPSNALTSFDCWDGQFIDSTQHGSSLDLASGASTSAQSASDISRTPLLPVGPSMSELEEWLQLAAQVSLPPLDPNQISSTFLEPFDRPLLPADFELAELHSSTPSPSMDDVKDASDNGISLSLQTFVTTNDIVLRAHDAPSALDVYYPKHHNLVDSSGIMSSSSDPPLSDFQFALPNKMPRQQLEKRRCLNDLYTPLWVRGEGINREGWCGLCATITTTGGGVDGVWLNLKTSQYLYHMQNTHGVDQRLGQISSPPRQLRVYNSHGIDRTDGLCGECKEWITICTTRRRRNFSTWFAHARSCHGSRKRAQLVELSAVPTTSSVSSPSTSSPQYISSGCHSPAPASTTSSAPILPRLRAARMSKAYHQRSASGSNLVSWTTTMPSSSSSSHARSSSTGRATQQVRPLFKRPRHR